MPRSVAVLVVLSALLATLTGTAGAQPSSTAVVRGAELVHMRRGPGTNHPAFRTVARGAAVTVEAVEGSWTRIRTADGERGYVSSVFLESKTGGALAPEVAMAAGAAPTPGATGAPGPTPPPQQPEVKAPTVEPSRTPISAVAPGATPAPGTGSDEDLRSDVRKLLLLNEEMHRRLNGESPAPTPAPFGGASSDAPGVASTLALTGAGLLVGFLIGTGYGRYQERNRRTRVRF